MEPIAYCLKVLHDIGHMLRSVLLFLALTILLPGTALARQLTIGMPCLNEECKLPRVEEFFREAYRRIGVEVQFLTLPSSLELDFADCGRTDGTMLRTDLVATKYENLVKVPFPLQSIDLVAYSVRDDIEISRPGDLAGYRVAVSRGNFTARMLARKMGVEPVMLNFLTSGIRMLEEGRLDVILEERNTMILAMNATGKQLRSSESLFRGVLYHWLNKRNEDLAAPLAEAFRSLDEEGVVQRLFGEDSDLFPEPLQ